MNLSKNSTIWIRHIEKLYKNGKANNLEGYQHDPGIVLSSETIIQVRELIKSLLEKYGVPKTFIISPYLRTRETAIIFLNILEKEHNIKPEIKYSTNISEYLGFCKKENSRQKANLHPETLNHFNFSIYLNESFHHFKDRIIKHIKDVEKIDENIWVITHGLILNTIYEYKKSKCFTRPNPLDYISKTGDDIFKSF